MRVILVSHQFPPDWVGGVERYTESLAAQLTRGGEGAPLRWGLRAAYFRRLLATPERIICPSRYVAAYFGEHLGRLAGGGARLCVIPNGIPAVPVDRAAPVNSRGEQRLTLAGER